jgi:hypothetical protein
MTKNTRTIYTTLTHCGAGSGRIALRHWVWVDWIANNHSLSLSFYPSPLTLLGRFFVERQEIVGLREEHTAGSQFLPCNFSTHFSYHDNCKPIVISFSYHQTSERRSPSVRPKIPHRASHTREPNQVMDDTDSYPTTSSPQGS